MIVLLLIVKPIIILLLTIIMIIIILIIIIAIIIRCPSGGWTRARPLPSACQAERVFCFGGSQRGFGKGGFSN